MEEKSMWKELLNRCRLAVNLFASDNFISDSYRGYCYFNFKCSTTVTVRTDSCWYFDCSVGTIYFWSS